jgi:hypothetical protein
LHLVHVRQHHLEGPRKAIVGDLHRVTGLRTYNQP